MWKRKQIFFSQTTVGGADLWFLGPQPGTSQSCIGVHTGQWVTRSAPSLPQLIHAGITIHCLETEASVQADVCGALLDSAVGENWTHDLNMHGIVSQIVSPQVKPLCRCTQQHSVVLHSSHIISGLIKQFCCVSAGWRCCQQQCHACWGHDGQIHNPIINSRQQRPYKSLPRGLCDVCFQCLRKKVHHIFVL